jgi:NAD(P)-dependent dehydrogenase (short-subunit alcohol dehydrogenase family)
VKRDLRGAVVVVTGASSGIGRATAHAFAREGAQLVLTARREEPLRGAAEECRRLGARAVALPGDVRSDDALVDIAQRAVDELGRIDVWVNCAGVMAYGRFEDLPSDVFRGVMETNFFGQVHGARAVLPHFRHQGAGVLINVNSVWGRITTPGVSSYVASKFALRGFAECLRQEVRDADGIEVVSVLPHGVDTPIFGRAANFSGRAVRPIPPLLRPETVAAGIVRCARSPRREVTYRYTARLLEALHAALPAVHHRLLPPAFEAGTFRDTPVAPTTGTVLTPEPAEYAVSGAWNRTRRAELARAFAATVRGAIRGR